MTTTEITPDHPHRRRHRGARRRRVRARRVPQPRRLQRPPPDGVQDQGPLRRGQPAPIHIAEDPLESSVEVEIPVASIDTRDETRDGHLRSADFFDADNHPTLRYRSTKVTPAGERRWNVEGELTVRGVTRPVPLEVTFEGGAKDPWGEQPDRLHRPGRAGPRGLRAHLEPGPRDRRRAGRQAGADRHRGRGRPPVGRPSSPDLWIGGGEIHLQFTGCSSSGPQGRFPRLRNRARGRGVTRTGLVAVDSRLWWAGRLLWGPCAPSLGGAPRPCTGILGKRSRIR